jgi:hypothetical protein
MGTHALPVAFEFFREGDKNNGRTATYGYVVNSSVNAEIAITYDATLDSMAKVHIDYFRYTLHIDFAKRVARGGLRGGRDGLALSY